jgi:hypothetical protein
MDNGYATTSAFGVFETLKIFEVEKYVLFMEKGQIVFARTNSSCLGQIVLARNAPPAMSLTNKIQRSSLLIAAVIFK